MKKDKELLRKVRQGVCSVALLSACMVNFSSCEKYDLDERNPEGWGASIYKFLQDKGNYQNTLQLINDLGLADQLNKTSSSTLFAANDDAFARFFQNNEWGVTNYGQLSLAQKKMLLKGSMISNPYQVHDLSSTENRTVGTCMRRISAQEYLDSVAVVPTDQLPNMLDEDKKNNPLWQRFKNRKEVVLLEDATTPPMLHFIEDFMLNNKITNEDYDFLFNTKAKGKAARQPGDASVNGVKILTQNNRCSNGFVHEMEDVIMPLTNMAETVRKDKDLSTYNKLLERFCYPEYAGKEITDQYNYIYKTNVDSVFEKRFFSHKSKNGVASLQDKEGHKPVLDAYMTYDPEWNTYFVGDIITTADERMKNDMGVMLVPSNKAMDEFWNSGKGAGAVLKQQYQTMDNVPNDVIEPLINNNLQNSFVRCVPSMFNTVLNSNNDPLGLKIEDIDRVILANNGAIYVTNKVFSPTEYVSVLYPSTVYKHLAIMKWGIEQNEYKEYLNSLVADYSLILHSNTTLDYIDPLSVMQNDPSEWKLYRFHYDENRTGQKVYATIHQYDSTVPGGNIIIKQDDPVEEDAFQLSWRLREILDASIVVNEEFDNSKKYYRTMGYQTIRVDNPSATKNGMTVMGSHQINEQNNTPLHITEFYDQSKANNNNIGNGKCYVIDGDQPLRSTFKTTMDQMQEIVDNTGEMSLFKKLIDDREDIFTEEVRDERYFALGRNIKSFNTFHYTVYVPTNAKVEEWLKKHEIYDKNNPSVMGWDYINTLNKPEDVTLRKRDSLLIENFVKLHFQDNSLFIGAKAEEGDYSTSLFFTDSNGRGRFAKVHSELTGSSISVQAINTGNSKKRDGAVCHVITKPNAYNVMAREFFFHNPWEGNPRTKDGCNQLYGASSIVIHLIDNYIGL